MKIKELIELLLTYPQDMRVVTPHVEDYGDSGRMEEITLGAEEVQRGEDLEEGEVPETVLMIDGKCDPEEMKEKEEERQAEADAARNRNFAASILLEDPETREELRPCGQPIAKDGALIVTVSNESGTRKYQHTIRSEEI